MINVTYLSVLIISSLVCAGVSFACFSARIIRLFFDKNKIYHYGGSLLNLLIFVVSIWLIRYSVEYYSIYIENSILHYDLINWFDIVFDSFTHTLQTFSIGDSYTEYIAVGKEMIYYLSDNDVLANIFGIYASVLNVVAPICGGAIVVNLLQGVFPGVRLAISKLAFWKKKYFFSELNEGSLFCAISILDKNKKLLQKPIIVFSGVSTGGEKDDKPLLLIKAKNIGAICLADKLPEIKNIKFSQNDFLLLINENELENIKLLADFADGNCKRDLFKANIRIFYQNNDYVLTEKTIIDKLKNQSKSKNSPDIKRTRCYQNLIFKLLDEQPLFKPLINRENAESLNIAILGNGGIGTEMFLASYWCGQLLDVKLSILVASKDSPEEARAKIDKINPEILESSKHNSEILKVYPGDEKIFNEPYFDFKYCECDLEKDCIDNIYFGDTSLNLFKLVDADYFFIALGSDDTNLRVAEDLFRKISIIQKDIVNKKKITIVYVNYDAQLCKILNDSKKSNNDFIEFVAIGSVSELYDYSNITMVKWNSIIKNDKPYDAWSNCAANIHRDYKVFSAYKYEFKNGDTKLSYEKYKEGHKSYICDNKNDFSDMLAWLEHRRWNAYMRSIGFRYNNEKDLVELRTHDCLVESAMNQIDGKKDFLDLVAEKRDPNIKNYDYQTIIEKEEFNNIIKDNCK